MPELPDVEAFKRYCDQSILKKNIEEVNVKVNRMLEVSKNTLRKHLKGKRFESTFRHGKHLFLILNDGYELVLHFGMSGSLSCFKQKEPEYSRMIVQFSNGYNLAYTTVRKLGSINIIKDRGKFIENKNLGPDALSVSFEEFKNIIEDRRSYAKTTLMNQKIIAGIGNIYSDEILFQAGIHPKVKISELEESKLMELFNETKEVLKTAIDKNADTQKLPENFLISHREIGAKCPVCGGEIKRISISGRHGYYCPKCQKNHIIFSELNH